MGDLGNRKRTQEVAIGASNQTSGARLRCKHRNHRLKTPRGDKENHCLLFQSTAFRFQRNQLTSVTK